MIIEDLNDLQSKQTNYLPLFLKRNHFCHLLRVSAINEAKISLLLTAPCFVMDFAMQIWFYFFKDTLFYLCLAQTIFNMCNNCGKSWADLVIVYWDILTRFEQTHDFSICAWQAHYWSDRKSLLTDLLVTIKWSIEVKQD